MLDTRRLFVTLASPDPGDDPQNLIISVIVGKQNLNAKKDGKLLYKSDFLLRTSPDRRYSPKMRLSLKSDSVMVDPLGAQEITKENYLLRRSEMQFRLSKLGDVPMESKKICITIQLGKRKLTRWTYLRWKKEKRTNDTTSAVSLSAHTIERLIIAQQQ